MDRDPGKPIFPPPILVIIYAQSRTCSGCTRAGRLPFALCARTVDEWGRNVAMRRRLHEPGGHPPLLGASGSEAPRAPSVRQGRADLTTTSSTARMPAARWHV